MSIRRLALAACVLVACAGGGGAGSPPAPAVAPQGPAGQWERMKARYGRLLPIAGKGATDTGGNEWVGGFEGGRAVDAELSRPHFAMTDAAGNIYIADKEAHAVRKVGLDGRIVTVAGTGAAGAADDTPGPATQRALANPNGLFVLPDGTLYIVDLDHGRVRKVTPGGVMSTLFRVPGGIAVGRGLWVAADESEVFFSSATVVKRWTSAGGVEDWAAGFTSLGSVVMDRKGRLLVGDRGADQVFALMAGDAGGVVKTRVAGSGTRGVARSTVMDGARAVDVPLDGARAVWPAHPADGDGFFVGTHEGCQLWFVDEAGFAHLFLDGAPDAHAGDGERFDTRGAKVSELRSVTLDGVGNVIIVEDDRGFVRKVERR